MFDFFLFLVFAYTLYSVVSRAQTKQGSDARQSDESRRRENAQRPRNTNSGLKDERYYAGVLQLNGQTNRDEIKKHYHELVSQYHPDKVNHLGPKLRKVAEEEMREINEAYNFFKKQYAIN